MSSQSFLVSRPRRNRASAGIRNMVRETVLEPRNLVLPLFVTEGDGVINIPIGSLPGCFRQSIDALVETAQTAFSVGVPAVALFPAIANELKTPLGEECLNPNGLLQRTIKALKTRVPGIVVITDVAMDPYTSHGHDGLINERGEIDNDTTLDMLSKMAVAQAEAGADVVAPSDMMDGRVLAIRRALDGAGFTNVLICSYCAKYASSFYGPFREALDSAPRESTGKGPAIPKDKKTYQMDIANSREALRELKLDEEEGADWVMVKPGLPYLDVVKMFRDNTHLPVAIYHVSGEYAMLKAAAEKGWVDYDRSLIETLTCMRRAGADIIFTYGAIEAARILNEQK